MESRAKELEKIGNYKSAADIYANLLKSAKNTDDQYYFSKKISNSKKLHLKVSELLHGEAFFPVFVEKNNSGAIFTIHFEKKDEYENGKSLPILSKNWKKIQPFLKFFLDDFLKKHLKHHYVFEWEFGKYFPFIKNIPSNNKCCEVFEQIDGNSLQLALVFAFLSTFLKVNLEKFVFSGKIEQIGNTIQIGEVDEIPTKLSIIKTERPETKLICNFESVDVTIETFKDLENAINYVIPKFAELLNDELSQNETLRKISLKVIPDIEAEDGQKHKLAKFTHGAIDFNETPLFYDYLIHNNDVFAPASEGIIIDGLKPAFGIALIGGMEEIKNTVSNFIAVRNTQNDSGELTSAVVIRAQNLYGKRKVGETFRYKNK